MNAPTPSVQTQAARVPSHSRQKERHNTTQMWDFVTHLHIPLPWWADCESIGSVVRQCILHCPWPGARPSQRHHHLFAALCRYDTIDPALLQQAFESLGAGREIMRCVKMMVAWDQSILDRVKCTGWLAEVRDEAQLMLARKRLALVSLEGLDIDVVRKISAGLETPYVEITDPMTGNRMLSRDSDEVSFVRKIMQHGGSYVDETSVCQRREELAEFAKRDAESVDDPRPPTPVNRDGECSVRQFDPVQWRWDVDNLTDQVRAHFERLASRQGLNFSTWREFVSAVAGPGVRLGPGVRFAPMFRVRDRVTWCDVESILMGNAPRTCANNRAEELMRAIDGGKTYDVRQRLRTLTANTQVRGEPALVRAARAQNNDIVQLLLASRAEVTTTHVTDGFPAALDWAVSTGAADCVETLLAHGALVRAPRRGCVVRAPRRGWTPLHTAVQCGRVDCAVLLLKSGGQELASVRTHRANETALDLAHKRDDQQMIEVFRKCI